MYSTNRDSHRLGSCIEHAYFMHNEHQLVLKGFNLEDADTDNVRVFVDQLNQLDYSISVLDFTNCRINAENMRIISEIDPDKATFEDIHCFNEDMTSLGLTYFVDLVKKCKRLRALRFNSNLFHQNLGVARFTMNALLAIKSLTVLHLINETVTPYTFPVFAACLATSTTLTSLTLSGTRLGASFAAHAGKFLGNPNWIRLNLNWMNLGDLEFAAIAEAITANPNLAKLNIKDNLATNAGYPPLLDAIAASSSLRSVKMSILADDVASFRRVSALMRANTLITSLSLHSLITHNVEEEVAQYGKNTPMLIMAMLENTTIYKLHIPSNPIYFGDINLLTKFIIINQTVRCLMAYGTSPNAPAQFVSTIGYNGALTKLLEFHESFTLFEKEVKPRNETNHLRRRTTFTELLLTVPNPSKRNRQL